MLRHVIAPSGRYTKASHDVVRHPRLNNDAKILLLYIQGLPEHAAHKPLSELAQKLGLKGRAYQKAKEQLVAHGYVHEWRTQGDRGRWVTEQLVANLPLTVEQACGLRRGPTPADASPSTRVPAVGGPGRRVVGGYEPVEDHGEKTTPHPPSEARTPGEPCRAPEPAPDLGPDPDPQPPAPELAEAERVLLSLRHSRRELHLGVREARTLAADAAKWLLRGVTAADLRRALLAELPHDGVRSAVGFLRYRLAEKLPGDPMPAPAPSSSAPVAGLVTCQGRGEDHAFRPVADETECASCRRAAAQPEPHSSQPLPTDHTPWRSRFAALNGASGLPGLGSVAVARPARC
ncbi:hypothetical protein AB0436_14285 [Streptomyces sp. NPDC051322]|uniref:hypothetical protein n=1 Tax=Streptomyces sp. NPDC051322 TaxID=3154645 RepID=UPI00344C5FDC